MWEAAFHVPDRSPGASMRLVAPPLLGILLLSALPVPSAAQYPPGQQGSSNIRILSHVPIGGGFKATDLEIEQELARPFAYASAFNPPASFHIISLKDPAKARVIYTWKIENSELHKGFGAMDNKYFKLKGRYYDVQSLQFQRGSPNEDLGAVVVDVTGLPDTSTVREAGRIRAPEIPNGFHNMFAYRHSDGRVLLFATHGPGARIYDMEKFLARDPRQGLIGLVPVPESPTGPGFYHDFYLGYDPATHLDKFYGAGQGGYYVYDVSRPESPKLLASVTGTAGVNWGHTFTPSPDGRYVVAETEYQYAPLRIFDLKPALDGQVKTISRPIGAWTPNWQNLVHNTEVRWPYVFVSGYEDGLHVFNMMDPTNPYTVAYYDTYDGPHNKGLGGSGVTNGAFGVDVRNADGLIVVNDITTGFWAFKMDGFDGWNGHQWGMPNVSSAQDWDNGPEGVPKPQRVS
jgi:hypothetical protein